MTTRILSAVGATVLAASVLAMTPDPASAGATGVHKNCTNFNNTYPHGVGRKGAVDKTSGDRVTNFFRSTKRYNRAMDNNKGLDRDKDGIACEKK